MKHVLQETIDLLISEVLGKFDLGMFKKIASGNVRAPEPLDFDSGERVRHPNDLPPETKDHPEIAYAEQFLPKLGAGSSRVTFALSGGKVLKIALNNAGIGQNEAELKVYTNNVNNSVVTKIFDYDPTFKWLVSELVKPLGGDEFKQFTGLTFSQFEIAIGKIWQYGNIKNWATDELRSAVGNLEYYEHRLPTQTDSREIEFIKNAIVKSKRDIGIFSGLLKKDSPMVKFLTDVVHVANENFLEENDVVRADHYGRTVDGQIKLYDYGFDLDVQRNHY